ncbi:MAG: ABC transporter ATP-binding protein [Gammaproteobacteria bacterium]|nr:ABC transporter ATP-binding protein [Gammaproteobacteria bacterium]
MIEIKELSFGYKAAPQLFVDLMLELTEGNIYGLLGKNGAGKTTLLKLIAGMLSPVQGGCQVMGYKPHLRHPLFLQDIYFIPEEFSVPPITVDLYVNLYAPFYAKFDYQAWNEALDEFCLPRDKKLHILSYGQKKKFLVAFALATNCKLLLLDEPTNGLDIPSKSQFRKLMARMLTEERSFIIATHQVRDLETLIDTVVILDEGRIIFNEPIYESETNLEILFNDVTSREVQHETA